MSNRSPGILPPSPDHNRQRSSTASLPPAPRNPKNGDLPPNLYESGGYYAYRDPRTDKRFGLGRDREAAIAQAKATNAALAPAATPSLLERVRSAATDAPAARTIKAFLPAYLEALEERDLEAISRYAKERFATRIGNELGDMEIRPGQEDAAAITERCSTWLRAISKTGKRNTARKFKNTLADMFDEMAAAGWIAINPVRVVRVAPSKVVRSRLSLDQFKAIYEAAAKMEPFVQRSMELGIVSLQRREDISNMGFRDEADGKVKVVQGKTGARLRIPLALRLNALGWTLEEVVARCRDDVLSRYMVHHVAHQGRARPGAKVHKQTITTNFRLAREAAGIETEPGKTPPTFHEIRSLGARLYKRQGYDPQELMGHRDPETTRIYTDDRGSEWLDVRAA